MFRGLFVALERASHAPDAARNRIILGFIGATTVLSYLTYLAGTKDNGSRTRQMLKVQNELRVNMK